MALIFLELLLKPVNQKKEIMFQGLFTALRTLTIIPLPQVAYEDERFDVALIFFPVVGFMVGGITAFLCWGISLFVPIKLGVILALLANVWLTRALHIDGFADVIDAYYGNPDVHKRLAIMKDPHIGSFGVVAIVFLLAIKAISILILCENNKWLFVMLPMVISRNTMVMLAVFLPYARAEGGKGEAYVKNAKGHHLLFSSLITLLVASLVDVIIGALSTVFGLFVGFLIRLWARKNFGGVTGDILGFTNEIIELLLLISFSIIL